MATDTLTKSVIEGDASRPNIYRNFIDGEWVESDSGETFEDRNPADTRDVVGIFQKSNKADVDAAVDAAKQAFLKWRRPTSSGFARTVRSSTATRGRHSLLRSYSWDSTAS